MRPPSDPRRPEPSAFRGDPLIPDLPPPPRWGPPMLGVPPPSGTPAWLSWLQVALSSMLAVLFLVTFVRTREQNLEIQRLRQRLRVLEASRSLDRGDAREAQLQAVVGRVQSLEEIMSRQLQASERERQRMEQQMLDLQTRPQVQRSLPAELPAGAAASPPLRGPRLQKGAVMPSGPMPLRPPPELP